MFEEGKSLNAYQQTVFELSERIVRAQRSIRILDAIKWGPEVQEQFFKSGFKKLPNVDSHYYQNKPLPYDIASKKEEFYEIERSIRRQLGQFSGVGNIMLRMCHEYCMVVRMLEARGQSEFTKISQELYGSSEDVFHAGAPNLKDLACSVSNTLGNIQIRSEQQLEEKIYTSEEAVVILGERMAEYFHDPNQKVRVELNDDIIADAAAGAEWIKLRSKARFSERDLKVLEVHEGWVHLGTTLNGLTQPVCTFLSKGPPSSTVTQEGLAIIMEIFTFASYPERVRKLTNRITAINMAEQGADFIEVFNFFRGQGLTDESSYIGAARVFRGSTPTEGPFTKDLVYSRGFVLIYNYIILAVQRGLLSHIPLLFLGKTTLEDLHIFADLLDEGLIIAPKYVPPQFRDLSALSAWMCYSLFLNQLDLVRLASDFKVILQG